MCGTNAEDAAEKGGLSPEPKPFSEVPRPPSRKRSRPKRIAGTIDKSALAFPEPRRVRDRDHVRYVAKQPCLICGRQPSDAHHLRFAQHSALGRKVSDEFTVPLCRGHHREIHRCGDEAIWWGETGIDPNVAARVLWLKTHPLPASTDRMVEKLATSSTTAELNVARNGPSPSDRTRTNKTKPIAAGGA